MKHLPIRYILVNTGNKTNFKSKIAGTVLNFIHFRILPTGSVASQYFIFSQTQIINKLINDNYDVKNER